ncbi:MAG: UMP kinase [Candidatus Eisenbacteria bacterium]|nr:UMP kinase [Candidatus Eisenbacteria bacterium]MCC7143566.1 UMP kinase [Candidatus Eisenbacteria bacterium]
MEVKTRGTEVRTATAVPEGNPRWRRILLKLSGEMLAGDQEFGLDTATLREFARQVNDARSMGCEVAIVVGGGNFLRGSVAADAGMDRAAADYMGMLATCLNALALQEHLERLGLFTRVLSAIKMEEVAEQFIRRRAIRHLEKGRVVIFAAGTGNPYFTTDTAAVLRAVETGCEVILKGTKVAGVYTADPVRDPSATLLPHISYQEVLEQNLRVMDLTAITLSKENRIPIVVFDVRKPDNLRRILSGEPVGTYVSEEGNAAGPTREVPGDHLSRGGA